MSDSNLRIGQKTSLYPFGYAFCQCGCQRLTKLNSDGVWASYIEDHEPAREPSDTDTPHKDKLAEQLVEPQVLQSSVGSTWGGEREQSAGHKQESNFGQASRFFPFGYGYCQCGCKGITEQFSSGIYPMYLPGHQSSNSNLTVQKSPHDGDFNLIDPATLKAGERLSKVIIKEPRSLLSPKRFVAPDQPLLELYINLVQQHELLKLQIKVVCLDLENILTLIKNRLTGSASEKQLVLERLQTVLKTLNTTP